MPKGIPGSYSICGVLGCGRKQHGKGYCESCYHKIYDKKYYAEYRNEMLEYNKKYRAAHPNEIHEGKIRYRAENRNKCKEYSREYRKDNKIKLILKFQESVCCSECGFMPADNYELEKLQFAHLNHNGKIDRARFPSTGTTSHNQIAWILNRLKNFDREQKRFPVAVMCGRCHDKYDNETGMQEVIRARTVPHKQIRIDRYY